MKQSLTYCYWGEIQQNIQLECGEDTYDIPITNKVNRNQIIVLKDVCLNEEYYTVFGKKEVNSFVKIEKEITTLRLIHPKDNTYKSIFNEKVYIEVIDIMCYLEDAEYNFGGTLANEIHRTIFILIKTNNYKKELTISPLHHSFRFYDEFGLVILNKENLLKYTYEKQLPSNLLGEIENTDLSNHLSHKGLMTILWGFRPWYYKIIITNELNFQLPVGIKVYETGNSRLNRINQIQNIYSSSVLENIESIKEMIQTDAFNNNENINYSIKFYVTGGPSAISEFEGLKVFIHIELSNQDKPIVEFDQVDPLDEFNKLLLTNSIGDGMSFNLLD